MKYPKEQYQMLVEALRQYSKYFLISSINNSNLHYTIYQQANEGQTHNALFILDGKVVKRGHQLTEAQKKNAKKLIKVSPDFKLYPDGCNDTHIETAVKNALKELSIQQ